MRGFTLIEMMATLGIVAIVLGIAVSSMGALDNPLNDTVQQVSAALNQSRLKAMANTDAYRVMPSSTMQLDVAYANNCAATTWTDVPAFARTLPDGIVFKSTAWSVCFDSRGLASNTAAIDLERQKDNKTLQIQVLLGGSVVQP